MEEKWIDADFKGIIKVYDLEPKAPNEYENLDDYDARHGIGGRFTVIHSRFDKEEI